MKRKVIGIFALLGIYGTGDAGTIGANAPNWHWVGSLSAGPTWGQGGHTQTFYLTPTIEKTYLANKSSNSLADIEIFLGAQRAINSVFSGQMGLAIGVTNNANLSGYIWDDADPEFNNYAYGYKIKHVHVAPKVKILADMGYSLTPWISGSLGVGFNYSSHYYNQPLLSEAVINPNFAPHTQTAFTYTLSAGVQKTINQNVQIGLGYEFSDWGQSRLGRAEGQTLNKNISLNHLYTNGVTFNLSYVL